MINAPSSISSLVGRTLVLLVVGLGAWTGLGATYYIDYVAGADSNNGTSKSTPWKHHPYQGGWSGTRPWTAHTPGDSYIFKGGVTWPMQQCSTMQIAGSGTVSTPDYYGVDVTWYTGPSWSKPVFDAQGQEFNGGWVVGIQIPAAAPQHDIQIDNLVFTRWYWSSSIRALGGVAHITIGASTNIRISNCEFTDWTHATYANKFYEDQLVNIVGYNQPPYTSGCVITNCLFDGRNAANSSAGTASCQASVFLWGGKIQNCIIRNTAGGLFPSGAVTGTRAEISGCTIGPMFISYDPTMHHDAIQDNGGPGVIVRDNYIFDIAPVPLFLGAGWGGGRYDVYNNIIDTSSQTTQTPITFDAQSGGNSFYVHNNTIIAGGTLSIFRANYRPLGGNQITLIDYRNNHLIGDGGTLSTDSGVTVSSTNAQNNLKQTRAQAAAAGYTRANWFNPTALSSPTVNQGQDLSAYLSGALTRDIKGTARPQSTSWDLGAVEYITGSTPPPPPPPPDPEPEPPPVTPPTGYITFSAATWNAHQTNGSITIFVARNGGSYSSITNVLWATHDGTALAGRDYTATNGVLTWADGNADLQTLTIPLLDSSLYTVSTRSFTITLSGQNVSGITTATCVIALLPAPTPVITNPGTLAFLSSSYSTSITNGSVTVSFARTEGTNAPITAVVATRDDTAIAGLDYTATLNTYVWSANENSTKTITIPILDTGTISITTRRFYVNFNALGGAAKGSPSTAAVTITQNSPLSVTVTTTLHNVTIHNATLHKQ